MTETTEAVGGDDNFGVEKPARPMTEKEMLVAQQCKGDKLLLLTTKKDRTGGVAGTNDSGTHWRTNMGPEAKKSLEQDVNLTLQNLPDRFCVVVADGKTLLEYKLNEGRQYEWSETEILEHVGAEECAEILAWALVTNPVINAMVAIPLVAIGWDSENGRSIVGPIPSHWKPSEQGYGFSLNLLRPVTSGITTERTTGSASLA